MYIRRLAGSAAGLSLLAAGLVAGAAPAEAVTVTNCVVEPVIPGLIVFNQPVERRAFRLKTTCRLVEPVTLKSFHSGVWWDTNTWMGNARGEVGNGATVHWARHENNAIPGHYHINAKLFRIATAPGTPVKYAKSTPVDYYIKDDVRGSLHLAEQYGEPVAAGKVQEYYEGWHATDGVTLQVKPISGGKWTEYASSVVNSDGSFSIELFESYAYYRAIIPATPTSVGFTSKAIKLNKEAPVPDGIMGLAKP